MNSEQIDRLTRNNKRIIFYCIYFPYIYLAKIIKIINNVSQNHLSANSIGSIGIKDLFILAL